MLHISIIQYQLDSPHRFLINLNQVMQLYARLHEVTMETFKRASRFLWSVNGVID